jgi:hypothetical protein
VVAAGAGCIVVAAGAGCIMTGLAATTQLKVMLDEWPLSVAVIVDV